MGRFEAVLTKGFMRLSCAWDCLEELVWCKNIVRRILLVPIESTQLKTMIRGAVMKIVLRSLILLAITGLIACGGGGGGGGGSGGSSPSPAGSSVGGTNSSSSLSSAPFSSSRTSSSQISLVLQPITRESAPYLVAGVIDAFDLAVSMPSLLKELMSEVSLLNDGQYTLPCVGGGTYSLAISNNRRIVTETYLNCTSDGDILSGQRHVDVLRKGETTSQVLIQFDNLNIQSASDSSVFTVISGDVEYEGEIDDAFDTDRFFQVELNVSVDDSAEGTIFLQGVEFQLRYTSIESFFPNKFLTEQAYAGKISWLGKGAANFEYSANQNAIMFTGSTDAVAKAVYNNELFIFWDVQGDGVAEAQLFIPDENSLLDALSAAGGKIVPSGVDGLILENNSLYMSRGKTYEVDIRKTLTHSGISLLDYQLIVDGNTDASSDWDEIEPGKFLLNFASNTEDKTYNLIFRARGTDEQDTYDIPVNFFVGSDYDNDQIPDAVDDDDDNDQVVDELDLYPFNEYESADSDADGIADNRDADADNDGVPNLADSRPLDPTNCSSNISSPVNTCYSDQWSSKAPWFMDKQGVIYFEPYRADFGVRSLNYYIYRLNASTGQYLDPIRMAVNNATYLPSIDKILYRVDIDELQLIDLKTLESSFLLKNEQPFSVNYVEPNHIVITVIRDRASVTTYAEAYDFSGQLISSRSVYNNDRQVPVVAPLYVKPDCPAAITSDFSGNLVLLTTNNFPSSCSYAEDDVLVSPSKQWFYRRSQESASGGIFAMPEHHQGGIFSTFNDSAVISIPAVDLFRWVGEGYVLMEQNVLTSYDSSGAPIASYSSGGDQTVLHLFTNRERIVLITRPSDSLKTIIRVFDNQFNQLNIYEY